MSSHGPEPLDNEERALAQRLARLGAQAEPSASLDASILSAAHAAASRRAGSRMQRRTRWPAAFGVAASLALAVGVAWQLRPLPQAPAYEESVRPVEMDAATAFGGPSADAAAAPQSKPLPAPAEPVERRASSAREQQAAAGSRESSTAEAMHSPTVVGEEAAQATASPPPPPPPAATATGATPEFVPAPPPAPTAPAPDQRKLAEQPARASNTASRPAPAAAPRPRNDAATDAELHDAAAAAEAGTEEGFDERPPNTADAPEVRQAWLQRIRELIASGDTTAARDSLQEFKRRYPDVILPDDLRRFDRPL